MKWEISSWPLWCIRMGGVGGIYGPWDPFYCPLILIRAVSRPMHSSLGCYDGMGKFRIAAVALTSFLFLIAPRQNRLDLCDNDTHIYRDKNAASQTNNANRARTCRVCRNWTPTKFWNRPKTVFVCVYELASWQRLKNFIGRAVEKNWVDLGTSWCDASACFYVGSWLIGYEFSSGRAATCHFAMKDVTKTSNSERQSRSVRPNDSKKLSAVLGGPADNTALI